MRYCLIFLSLMIFGSNLFAANLKIESDFSLLKDDLSLSSLKSGSIPAAVSRIFCPPLLRLNSLTSRFEPIGLLTAPVVISSKIQTVWRFRMRPGVKWWDGTNVTPENLQEFFQKNLSQALQLNLGAVDVPDFSVNVAAGVTEITWTKPPTFGPYAIADFPFFRNHSNQQLPYECIGFFKPNNKKSFSSIGRGPPVKVQEVSFETSGTADLQFSISSKDKCSSQTETSVFSGVVWNQSRFPFDQSSFRKALTAGIPRGEILRGVFLGLGDLISLPSSRRWSIYDNNLKVRPYDPKAVSQALNNLGFKREIKDGFFKDSSNKELVLNLYVTSKSNGVLEKMITDSYAEAGLRVKIKSEFKESDGALIAMQFGDSPLEAARLFLKAGTIEKEFGFNLGSKMQAASAALLTNASKAAVLADRTFHKAFFDEEPLSLIMQHQACVRRAPAVPAVDLMNPDWLRNLVQ